MSYFDDLYIVETTYHIFGPHISRPIDPPYFTFCLLHSGSLQFIVDGVRNELKGPVLFWAGSGHLYQFTTPRKRETIWLVYGGKRADRIWKNLEKDIPSGFVALHEDLTPLRIFREIISLARNDTSFARRRITVLTEDLTGYIYDESLRSSERKVCPALPHSVANQIQNDPLAQYDFRKIATENSVSYDFFRKKFKAFLGMPPKEFLLSCRLKKAMALLTETPHYSIKEIADLCGFKEASDFSRMFRRKSGFYPRAYRQRFSEKTS
ncbi:MAG: HTH-type transcriptional activator RhaS [Lentisphaerae bacterium ADurb.Bin242]|nr:MAG: HTH-type transcriptional activator RhaS [Lentisphaerae bacterium ADurb.Bin242]